MSEQIAANDLTALEFDLKKHAMIVRFVKMQSDSEKIALLKEIVKYQANIESLWPDTPPRISEALLAAALRHIHAIIEDDGLMAKISKSEYWNVESEL